MLRNCDNSARGVFKYPYQAMQRILVYWLPVVLWSAVILHLGTSDVFSAERTRYTIREVVGTPPPQRLRLINFTVRKFAHLVEYSILAALAFRAVRAQRSGFSARSAAGALLVVFAVASTDELLQGFVVSRSAQLSDVALDCMAGVLTLILIWVASKITKVGFSRS
jgi:VanZ family protein